MVIQEPQGIIHKSTLSVIMCWSLKHKERSGLSDYLPSPTFLSCKRRGWSLILHLSYSPVPHFGHSQSPPIVSPEHLTSVALSLVLTMALVDLCPSLFLDCQWTVAALLVSHLHSHLFLSTIRVSSLSKILLTDYRIK